MPDRQERAEAPEGSTHAAGDGSVVETLSRILESYYGARQLETDLDLFPNALTADQRRTLEESLKLFRNALGPSALEIGRLLLSPSSTARLVSAIRSDPHGASRWDRFRAGNEAFRDALARATRALRVRKATGDFLEPEADARSPSPDATEAATLERDKRENEQLLALEVLTASTRPSSRPTRVLLDVTNKCNFRCRTCYQSHGQDFVSNDLDSQALDGLRAFMRVAKIACVAGTGEPLLSPLTPHVLRLAASYGAETELVTNGSLLHRLAGLEDSVTRLFLSLDGASEETVNVIRKGAKFSAIVRAVRDLPAGLRARIFLNMVVCRPNLHEVHQVARLARELGVAEVHLQEFHAYLPWHGPLKLLPEDLPMLEGEIARAERELSGSNIPFRAQFNRRPARVASAEPPDHRMLLDALDRVPPPASAKFDSWDDCVRRLRETAELDVPGELLAGLSVETLAADASVAKSPDVGPEDAGAKRKRLLAVVRSQSCLTLPHCIAPYALLYVLGDGAMRPCCIIEHRAGDLRSGSIDENWHAPAYVALRRALSDRRDLPKPCVGCRDGSRFAMLHGVLSAARSLGVDLERIELPSDGELPRPVLELVNDAKEQAECDPALIRGHFDHVNGRKVVGWAFHSDRPSGAENVDVFVDGEFVVRVRAAELREDLVAAGIGDGRHGFLVELPAELCDGQVHEVTARFARNGADLVGSPARIRLA